MIILETRQTPEGKIAYMKNASESLIEIGSKLFLIDGEVTVEQPCKVYEHSGVKFKVWVIEHASGGFTPITEMLTEDQQAAVTLN